MQNHPSLRGSRRGLTRALWLGVALLLPALASAQDNAAITGRVADSRTGYSLQGAVIRVDGSSAVAYSDANGRFRLAGLPAGNRALEVEYVGLDPLRRNVAVTAGTTVEIELRLESRTLQMEAFTVAESVRGQALAINQQKTASGLVNIVSE